MDVSNIILDSNIVIYTGLIDASDLHEWLHLRNVYVSVITEVEVLGYHKLTKKDKNYFASFFHQSLVLPITQEILQQTIQLKQNQKMSLGDAIIAATALENDLILATANTKDFKHIKGIKLINPMTK